MADYLIDDYVTTKTGEAFRLFPFGELYKNGVKRNITPEFARTVRLPHFKAPVKLGAHDETTPAGGHIVSLEVRADGLYAIPEWNESGQKAINDGAYRYNSPEILWDGALENPSDGSAINAPIIVGTALLHMPHLGEATAMYSITPIKENVIMDDNITMPKSLFDQFIAPLFKREPEIVKVVPEDYEATKLERNDLKAKLEAQAFAAEKKVRIDKFDAALKETKADPTLAELLAELPDEKAELVMRQFKALSAQINESAVTGEKGQAGAESSGDPKAEFNAAVLAIVADKKINYNAAFEEAKAKLPDLFKSAFTK